MAISRKSEAPSGVTNASGEPEILLELDGLVLSMKPPATSAPTSEAQTSTDLRK
ncbi:MAG TPA: hypothetical protein PK020_01940 [Ilumatobacteraceae bacterium]|nr:hypothetical protein [Ilumatobacteraceae bacterium]HRB05006.1 hypothetical protein [Ilumatobacteraceae bacterium]